MPGQYAVIQFTPSALWCSLADAAKGKIMTEIQQTPELKAIPAEELLDTTYAPSGTLIDGLMGQGIYILAGAPKVGKSWLVLWLANQVSKGEPVWGLKTEKCGVLYISLEDTFQRIQKRLNDVSGGNPGSIWLATEAMYISEGFEEQLVNFLAAHANVKLVIIDTLQRIRKAGQEQYNYASDYETVCALKKIADRFLVTVLVVHQHPQGWFLGFFQYDLRHDRTAGLCRWRSCPAKVLPDGEHRHAGCDRAGGSRHTVEPPL